MTDKLELKSCHEVLYTVDVADVDSIFYCKPTDPDILTVLMKDGKRLYCDEVCPIDSLQEEPVNEDLEKAAREHSNNLDNIRGSIDEMVRNAYKAGAKWQKENLWKPADGDDLPVFDREVTALLNNGKIVFAHRPNPDGWDGKSVTTGKVWHYIPKTYDKGGWNIPDIKYWLDIEFPKEIEL